ncbi:P-loop containing nucleoside triphosphate hydrolase protein [Pholiota conissans]|uniref:P-loop containing nucleoside triphosphate hydrolase protein n=1 Tax=Pholiota conissans TaxID=109636 RepID=A0A9P5ZCX9_9AGAR|nr:P-loop containing nucleoside triphosphate hydrolase protein [Pholiota conissans]
MPTFQQTFFDGNDPLLNKRLDTLTTSYADIGTNDILKVFDHAYPLGLAPGYLTDGTLAWLAISDEKNCRIVQFQQVDANTSDRKPKKVNRKTSEKSAEILQDGILCRKAGDLFAFDMGHLSMALYFYHGLRITQAVDIQSAFPEVRDRAPLGILKDAFKGIEDGSITKIKEPNVHRHFEEQTLKPGQELNGTQDVAMRAWLAQFIATYGAGERTFAEVPRIDTKKLSIDRIATLAKMAADSLRLDTRKPTQITHQVSQSRDATTGDLQLNSQNYNTKLRGNKDIKVNVIGPQGSYTVDAQVAAVSGRAGSINTRGYQLTDKTVTTVTSSGPEAQTTAEAKRDETLLRILQGKDKSFDEIPWIKNIWSPAEDGALIWPKEWTPLVEPELPPPSPATQKLMSDLPMLNNSQQNAVNAMVSQTDEHRITIVQGPPGTGKTSVIASFVHFSVNMCGRRGIWLVAQSNVAVKNIAEKLISTNFTNWKLVVSKDFHFDWHEHIYSKVNDHIVRSDQIAKATGRLKLKDTHVVLCTLSMLSNSAINQFMKQIPFTTLVIDEASQIEIGNYIPVFSKFKALRKVCFIGDDKQLPPHGQESIEDLKSIFEVDHLKDQVLFLDTQYHMPPQIGRVISKVVYENKLKSNPRHPIHDQITACFFLDVDKGKEIQLENKSFQNTTECFAILMLASKLQDEGKSYKIITPYAAQTTFIETTMKENGLAWEDKCFNVDSFQAGH